jgi:hypothetical protein
MAVVTVTPTKTLLANRRDAYYTLNQNQFEAVQTADGVIVSLRSTFLTPFAGCLNASSYGSDGDAIQDAIDDLSGDVGSVFIDPGYTFGIDTPISVPSNVTIFGVPGISTIKALNGLGANPIIQVASDGCSDIGLQGIIIDGDDLNYNMTGADFRLASRVHVDRCIFQKIAYLGLNFSGCTDSIAKENRFLGIKKAGSLTTSLRIHSYSTTQSQNVDAIRNYIYDSGGFNFSPQGGNCVRNIFKEVYETAIFNSTGGGVESVDLTISENFIDTTISVSGSASGIEGAGERNSYNNNIIKNTARHGIVITNCSDSDINGNNISNCGEDGTTQDGICIASYGAGNKSQRIAVTSNNIRAGSYQDYGISSDLNGGGDQNIDCSVVGNILVGSGNVSEFGDRNSSKGSGWVIKSNVGLVDP